jgi:hypothetical protein
MTLAQAQAQLDAWLAASIAVAAGKEHRIGDRAVRFEDGSEIRAQIVFWQGRVNALTATAAGYSGRMSSIALADFSDD